MNIENQKIKVRVNNFNEKHFINLGYNVKRNDYIEIFIKELPVGSGLKIDVQCNYCKEIFRKSYRRYLETKDNLCCNKCKSLKMMETSIERFGNKCSLRNEEILKKSIETNLNKLGVEYPFQNKDILIKCLDSFNKNGKTRAINISKAQIRIVKLYDAILNYIEFPYRIDGFFEKENIYFEYDGSGHKLGIRFGIYTEEEFEKRQEERNMFLKEKGYKEFRIISNDDVLPKNKILLDIKQRAFDLLLNKNYNNYIYNLNTKTESFKE